MGFKDPSTRPPDGLMTVGVLVLSAGLFVGGVSTLVTGSESDIGAVPFAIGASLVALGYVRLLRRVGAPRAHKQLWDWFIRFPGGAFPRDRA